MVRYPWLLMPKCLWIFFMSTGFECKQILYVIMWENTANYLRIWIEMIFDAPLVLHAEKLSGPTCCSVKWWNNGLEWYSSFPTLQTDEQSQYSSSFSPLQAFSLAFDQWEFCMVSTMERVTLNFGLDSIWLRYQTAFPDPYDFLFTGLVPNVMDARAFVDRHIPIRFLAFFICRCSCSCILSNIFWCYSSIRIALFAKVVSWYSFYNIFWFVRSKFISNILVDLIWIYGAFLCHTKVAWEMDNWKRNERGRFRERRMCLCVLKGEWKMSLKGIIIVSSLLIMLLLH